MRLVILSVLLTTVLACGEHVTATMPDAGCSGDVCHADDAAGFSGDGARDAEDDAKLDAGNDAASVPTEDGGSGCDANRRTEIEVDVRQDTRWDCGTYVLNRMIVVEPPFIVTRFQTAVNLAALTAPLATEWPSDLSIEHSVFFNNTAIGNLDSNDDDLGFNEDDATRDPARNNVFDVDPMLGTDVTDPDYKPASTMLGGKATPPAGFDTTADYAGAVDPEGDDWTTGWTAYPVD